MSIVCEWVWDCALGWVGTSSSVPGSMWPCVGWAVQKINMHVNEFVHQVHCIQHGALSLLFFLSSTFIFLHPFYCHLSNISFSPCRQADLRRCYKGLRNSYPRHFLGSCDLAHQQRSFRGRRRHQHHSTGGEDEAVPQNPGTTYSNNQTSWMIVNYSEQHIVSWQCELSWGILI